MPGVDISLVGGAAPPQSPPLQLLARLGRGRGETWLARDDDGTLVAAKRLSLPAAAAASRLRTSLTRLRRLAHPQVLGVSGWRTDEDSFWVLSELDDGVCLRRFFEVVVLTPGQALILGHAVVAGLAALHGAGLVHGALHAGNVHLAADGRARVGDAGLVAATDDPAGAAGRSRDMSAAAQLLRAALGTAGPAPAGPAGAARQHTRLLAERMAGALDEGARHRRPSAVQALAVIEEAAGEELDEPRQQAGRAQLAALVEPLRRRLDFAPSGLPPLTVIPPRGLSHGSRWQPGRWWPMSAVLALGAIAVAVAVAVAVAAHHTSGTPGGAETSSAAAGTLPRPTVALSAPPAPRLSPVTPPGPPSVGAPAPAAAGDITGIGVDARQPCLAGGEPTCRVHVRVDLGPHPQERVAWRFYVVDRCTGSTTYQPGSAAVALASYDFVFDTTTVALSTARPVAVFAVTTAPSAAASPALLLGSAAC